MPDRKPSTEDSLLGLATYLEDGPSAEARMLLSKASSSQTNGGTSRQGLILGAARASLIARDQSLYPIAIKHLQTLPPHVGAIIRTLLFGLSGDARSALESAQNIPDQRPKNRLQPNAVAVWALCLAGKPEWAWSRNLEMDPEDPVGAIAMLQASFDIGHQKEQQKWLDVILEQPSYDWVSEEMHQPNPDIAFDPFNWLTLTLQNIGARIFWLTTKRKKLEALILHNDPNIIAQKGIDEALISAIKADDLIASVKEYEQLAKYCSFHQCMIPTDWIHHISTLTLQSEQIDYANHLSEEFLLNEDMSKEAISLWYHYVWQHLINQRASLQAAHLHQAVYAKTGNLNAACQSAKHFLRAEFYADAHKIAQKLSQYYGFEKIAKEIKKQCSYINGATGQRSDSLPQEHHPNEHTQSGP